MSKVTLPTLVQHPSPNFSNRTVRPNLIVVHRPVGSYAGSVATLSSPAAQVSAHVITDSNRGATQLVPWDKKAWACVSYNSQSYNIEVDDNAWALNELGAIVDPKGFATAARIVAYICHETGIPARWVKPDSKGVILSGVTRHYDLGAEGGGHTDPTTDDTIWRNFVTLVQGELKAGGFRDSWGVGTLEGV